MTKIERQSLEIAHRQARTVLRDKGIDQGPLLNVGYLLHADTVRVYFKNGKFVDLDMKDLIEAEARQR